MFSETHGDLSAVYEAIFVSPEFWSDAAFDSKIKTPLELSASAMRALGATVTQRGELQPQLARMGEPLYRAQPPTGYKEAADAWVNTGALVAASTSGSRSHLGAWVESRSKLKSWPAPRPRPTRRVGRQAGRVFSTVAEASTRDTIVNGMAGAQQQLGYQEPITEEVPRAIGLLLGSPEFQKQ